MEQVLQILDTMETAHAHGPRDAAPDRARGACRAGGIGPMEAAPTDAPVPKHAAVGSARSRSAGGPGAGPPPVPTPQPRRAPSPGPRAADNATGKARAAARRSASPASQRSSSPPDPGRWSGARATDGPARARDDRRVGAPTPTGTGTETWRDDAPQTAGRRAAPAPDRYPSAPAAPSCVAGRPLSHGQALAAGAPGPRSRSPSWGTLHDTGPAPQITRPSQSRPPRRSSSPARGRSPSPAPAQPQAPTADCLMAFPEYVSHAGPGAGRRAQAAGAAPPPRARTPVARGRSPSSGPPGGDPDAGHPKWPRAVRPATPQPRAPAPLSPAELQLGPPCVLQLISATGTGCGHVLQVDAGHAQGHLSRNLLLIVARTKLPLLYISIHSKGNHQHWPKNWRMSASPEIRIFPVD